MSHDFEDSAAEGRTKALKKYKLSLSLSLFLYHLHIVNDLVSQIKYSYVNGNLLWILKFANFHNLHTLSYNGHPQTPLHFNSP